MTSLAVKSIALEPDWCAKTALPIELDGREVHLEALAYQGKEQHDQALVLIHRGERTAPANDVGCQEPQPEADGRPIVRVHSGCVTGDIFHSLKCDCYAQLKSSLRQITNSPLGVMIYLPSHEGRGIGLVNKIKAYALQERGLDTVDANLAVGAPAEARDFTLTADILRDLQMTEIHLLTNNPYKVEMLEALGITVISRLPVVSQPTVYNQRYLETKRERMAHRL